MTRIKRALRALLNAVLPASAFQRIAAVRSRQCQVKFFRETGVFDRVNRHIEEHGSVVLAGLFKGMIYPLESATNRWSVPKLLGTYEDELYPFLEDMHKRQYDCIIDVGTAEGYYAVGLARMFQVPVYAYDPEPYEKTFSAKMAERNGVDHLVRMGALFTADDMREHTKKRVLMVCDCEGFEEVLFRPDTLELARNWDILIELHGTANTVLPALPWPHATALIEVQHKPGDRDEQRTLPQRFLLCDSQSVAPRVA